MKRTKANADITKNLIIKAAIKVFYKKGFNNTRLEDIALEAKVTRGAIYHHFGNKFDLFRVIRGRSRNVINLIIDEKIKLHGKSLDTILIIFTEFFREFEENEEFRSIIAILYKSELSGLLSQNKDINDDFNSDFNKTIYDVISIAKIEQKRGVIDKRIKLGYVGLTINCLFLGITTLWLMNEGSFSIKKKGTIIIENYLNSIRK